MPQKAAFFYRGGEKCGLTARVPLAACQPVLLASGMLQACGANHLYPAERLSSVINFELRTAHRPLSVILHHKRSASSAGASRGGETRKGKSLAKCPGTNDHPGWESKASCRKSMFGHGWACRPNPLPDAGRANAQE